MNGIDRIRFPGKGEVPTIAIVPRSELTAVNRCYARVEFRPSGPADLVVAAEAGGCRAGFGRLTPVEADSAELGGIYVLPEYRGRGIAARIVAFLLAHSRYRRLYCIPFMHLEGFCREFGFEPLSDVERVPPPVLGKLDWCRRTYPQPVVLLRRRG